MTQRTIRTWAVAGLVGMALLVAGCGNRNAGSGSGASDAAAAVPTMPAARFAMPTTMIGASQNNTGTVDAGEAVTETAALTNTAAVTGAAEAGTPEPPAQTEVDLTRGQTIYTNRNCAECHGEQGEGVTGQGSAVAGTALALDEFTDIMRTGRNIGPEHIYGPSAISPGGMAALHAWLQSLPAQ